MQSRLHDYALLMRLNKPIGIYLLLWPTLWALWLASGGLPRWDLLAVFVLGTVLMRSAGCVINDFADRKIDPHVERTRDRPIAAGRVSPREALVLFAVLCLLALLIASRLNAAALWLSLPAVVLAASYPFAKRFHSLPQAHLGIAFSWGIPIAYAAVRGAVPWGEAGLLMAANLCWVIAYDTYYAMSDREDDLKIGVKSSAILFGRHDRAIVGVLHLAALALLVQIGILTSRGAVYYGGLLLAAVFAIRQQWMTRQRQRDACFKAFLDNNGFGAAVFAGIVWDIAIAICAATQPLAAAMAGDAGAPLDKGCFAALPAAMHQDGVADYGYCVQRDVTFTPAGWPQALQLDLFQPRRDTPSPVVLLIYGGNWQHGNRRSMDILCRMLSRRGYVALNLSHRFPPAYRFPAQLQDLQQAVRWIDAKAAQLHADPQRLAVWGYSSGAHLAAMLALIDPRDPWGAPDINKVKALVGEGMPVDLSQLGEDASGLLGATREQDPALYRHASPLYQVSAQAPPTFLYHGAKDDNVPVAEARLFSRALSNAGVPVQLIERPDAMHGRMPPVETQAAIAFLDRILKP